MKYIFIAFLFIITVFCGGCERICNHEYIGTTLKDAQCVTVGEREYECLKCKHKYIEILEALWHDADSEGKCTRCKMPIETNLWYSPIEDKDEYSIIGVYDATALNANMIIEKSFNGKPITEIAENALCNIDVDRVDMSPEIKYVRTSAFSGSLVREVNLSSSLISIGEGAFRYCKMLTKITLYSSVMYIGADAFNECISLNEVVFYGTREQFNKISIMSGNEVFKSATITFINN